jgi:Ca2+-binding RTX toxin-like protein
VPGWFAQDRADTLVVEFADGTRWSSADLHAMTAVAASPGRDWLYGTPGVDMLAAGAGDDVISAGAGDDRIDGGPGDDRLDGGSGNDVFVFGRGAGRDEIVGSEVQRPGEVDSIVVAPDLRPADLELVHEAGRSVLRIRGTTDEVAWGRDVGDVPVASIRFADGTVWSPWPSSPAVQTGTEAADRLTGGELDDLLDGLGGADVLVAGAGHDVLRGGAGDDELYAGDDAHRDRLEGGPGDDRLWVRPSDVVVFGRGDARDTVYASGGPTLELRAGIDPADVRLRAGPDGGLVVGLRGTADEISLSGYFWNAEVRHGTVLAFADGTRWDADALLARLDRTGSPGDDVLRGSGDADSLSGGAGRDLLIGADGNDRIDGGEGQDTLYGEGGDDDLRGGAGDDLLVGGVGRDTFHVGLSEGRDRIADFGDGSITLGRPGDRLRFGEGIRPEDIRLSMNQYHELLLQVGSTGDSVDLGLWFSANHVDSTATIEFADGTVWQRSDVAQRWHLEHRAASWSGSLGHDTMVGHDGHETLRGLGGDDHLVGHAGDDMLVGGDGRDRLEGGADTDALHGGFGDDTYVFRRGDGRDRIVDIDLVGGRDRLVFGPGIDAGDLLVQTQAHELTLALRGTDDAVTIAWDPALGLEVEELHFADGSTWRTADLVAAVSASADLVGTVGDDLLAGNALANRLAGGAGRDTLDGGDGQDELVGGTGRDLLRGGRGGDLYRIGAADGSDVIAEVPDRPGEHDVLAFGPGIRPDQLWFRREGDALEVRQLANGERTLIEGWYAPGGGRIEEFRTDSGHALMERQVQALVEAMAGFAPPPPGSSALPSPTAALLAPVIGAHWSAPGG